MLKKILGISTVILGAFLIFFSFYIKDQVAEGRKEISEAKEKVAKGKKLFSLNPVTKEVTKGLTDSAEKKIKEGIAKADRYERLVIWFQISGGIFLAVGIGLIFIGKKKK